MKGEEGFDIKYSQHGAWGKGLYFARFASYSNLYCSNYVDGVKGMFLAKVLAGKVQKKSDHCWGTKSDNSNLLGPSANFDSVFGIQKLQDGSKHNIYIVYANKKAYPQYFIKYIDKVDEE